MLKRKSRKEEFIAFVMDGRHSEIITYIMNKPKQKTQNTTEQTITKSETTSEQLEK